MNAEFWIQCLRYEYLSTFIRAGGSSVKFVLCPSGSQDRDRLKARVAEIATQEQYFSVTLDARAVKLHLVDRLFYFVASVVEWRRLAYELLCSGLNARGLRFRASTECVFELAELAEANAMTIEAVSRSLKEIIQSSVFGELNVTSELRLALVQLCLARIRRSGIPVSQLENAVLSWLTGTLPSITALKDARIHQRIGRHNARHILYSLCHLTRKYLHAGTVLIFDLDQYLQTVPVAQRVPDLFYYSPANTMDLYETLREFVDDVDTAPGLLLVIAVPPSFLDEPKRGVSLYQALKMRIWNDVRGKTVENPVAGIVTVM